MNIVSRTEWYSGMIHPIIRLLVVFLLKIIWPFLIIIAYLSKTTRGFLLLFGLIHPLPFASLCHPLTESTLVAFLDSSIFSNNQIWFAFICVFYFCPKDKMSDLVICTYWNLRNQLYGVLDRHSVVLWTLLYRTHYTSDFFCEDLAAYD